MADFDRDFEDDMNDGRDTIGGGITDLTKGPTTDAKNNNDYSPTIDKVNELPSV
jgi:hypothetical protein